MNFLISLYTNFGKLLNFYRRCQTFGFQRPNKIKIKTKVTEINLSL